MSGLSSSQLWWRRGGLSHGKTRGSPKEVSLGIFIATIGATRCQWLIHSVRCDAPGSSYGYRRRPHGCLTQRTPRIKALMGLQECLPLPTLSRSPWGPTTPSHNLVKEAIYLAHIFMYTRALMRESCQLTPHWVCLCPLHPSHISRIYCRCCSARHGSSRVQVWVNRVRRPWCTREGRFVHHTSHR